MTYLPAFQLPGVHALCSGLVTILPVCITARGEESSARPHDRTNVRYEFAAGIVSRWE
jgi:hypothetical protein